MREPITTFTSRYVALRADNVDTDQIIPARFLTTTQRTGLGEHLFHDWRHLPDGRVNPAFPLNGVELSDTGILVTGRNFGCGSSREHAVWALASAGFRAVISESFADIFRGNALGTGFLPIQVEHAVANELLHGIPAPLTIDLQAQTVSRDGMVLAQFPIPTFAKHCLLRGIDELEFLLDAGPAITDFETRLAMTQ